jgi:predicted SnoaL-like aldol condensation-catalyzing enzyme
VRDARMKKIIPIFTTFALLFIFQVSYAYKDPVEINKQHVIEFYEKAINQKDFEAASKYLGSRYTQHNPTAADGPLGLKAFIQFLRDKYPYAHSEIKRVFAEGDYVILHVHSIREPGTRGRAIFDLFKLENGKIIEHWDTVQDIPEKSENSNGMF